MKSDNQPVTNHAGQETSAHHQAENLSDQRSNSGPGQEPRGLCCPRCHHRFAPLAQIFRSMLPFWITCPKCRFKSTLRRKRLYWCHVSLFFAVLIATVQLAVHTIPGEAGLITLYVVGSFLSITYLAMLTLVLVYRYELVPISHPRDYWADVPGEDASEPRKGAVPAGLEEK